MSFLSKSLLTIILSCLSWNFLMNSSALILPSPETNWIWLWKFSFLIVVWISRARSLTHYTDMFLNQSIKLVSEICFWYGCKLSDKHKLSRLFSDHRFKVSAIGLCLNLPKDTAILVHLLCPQRVDSDFQEAAKIKGTSQGPKVTQGSIWSVWRISSAI